ncbi:MAG TPA: hypothetical protein VFW10_03310 [Steroidobacteraceae bacterium]|nr:hypothetical protein [Steroidobacteraceae bacterium]
MVRQRLLRDFFSAFENAEPTLRADAIDEYRELTLLAKLLQARPAFGIRPGVCGAVRLRPCAPESRLTPSGEWWDNPTMILTLDAKRRLTVPANLAPAEPGDHFIAEFDPEEDAIVFRRLARRADWLAVLRACPVEMDDVPQRSRQLPKRRRL